jgi:hypothetical protein
MKFKLHLKPNRLFLDGCETEVEDKDILTNDVTLPWDLNPNNTKLWVIGNEYSALGAVWADCEQDALDELVDQDMHGGLSIDEENVTDDTLRAGNHGEPIDSQYLWMGEVDFKPERDCKLLCKLAEARGAQKDNLDF